MTGWMALRKPTLNCRPWVRSLTLLPESCTQSSAEMAGRMSDHGDELALVACLDAQHTEAGFSMWQVTRSISPARTLGQGAHAAKTEHPAARRLRRLDPPSPKLSFERNNKFKRCPGRFLAACGRAGPGLNLALTTVWLGKHEPDKGRKCGMHMSRRGLMTAGMGAAFGCVTLAAPRIVSAQSAWPAGRPIQIIVPFPPGGGTDINIRAMTIHFERHLPGARFVVVNRPGAGAEIGYTAMAQAAPDGYTMGTVITPSLQTITIERQPRYRLEDFAYLGTIVEDPSGLHVAPDSPFRSAADLVSHARAHPGTIAVGTAGIGSDDHLLMIGLERAAGIQLNHIPFAGQAPTVTALIGGHIQVASMNMGESVALIREGRVRPLAAAGPERFAMTPDVPTFREAGLPLDTGVVRSFVTAAATPRAQQVQLAGMIEATMRDPAWIAEAERLFVPLRYRNPEDTRALVFREATALRAVWQDRPWKDE
jgi:tripartite-type tricarboxylate transporter receptor subunit TctC